MTLEKVDVLERKKLTRSYPVLVSGYAGCGKSSAVEFLSPEDKARTVIFNFDHKTLPEDEESQYFKVKYLNNPDDKKPTDIFQSIDAVRATIAIPGVDRIIIDTFSGYYKELDAVCNQRYNGFDVWKAYNAKIGEFLNMLKTETQAHGKFVYVLAHYKPVKKELGDRKTVSVRGNEWYALIESEFNTVIEATVENGEFRFIADNSDEFTSTRVRRALSPIETSENSLEELELLLTGATKEPKDAAKE